MNRVDAAYGGTNTDHFKWHEDDTNKITCLFYIIDEHGSEEGVRPEGGDLRMTVSGSFQNKIDNARFSAPANTISIAPETGLMLVFPGKWLRSLFILLS